ncbi:uncharacterized protein METZ01_LOCUS104540 [marine metagenome]|uniref:Uncharacterized protein n=1 Tax=marine metagenome TaxID=408172 RepID=A0A381WGM7_9ZZZZ
MPLATPFSHSWRKLETINSFNRTIRNREAPDLVSLMSPTYIVGRGGIRSGGFASRLLPRWRYG